MADETALLRPHRLVVVVFRSILGAELAILGHRRAVGANRRLRRRPVAKVVEHRRVEPLIAGPLLGSRIGVEEPPAVGLVLEGAAERLDQAGVLLLLLERLPVVLEHDGVDEMPTGAPRGGVDELLGAAAIPPEAAGDQQEQAEPEQEAAFPLQARLADDVGDRSVGHGELFGSSTSLARSSAQAQRRKAWGEPPQGAVSSVVSPRPHGRSAFTRHALNREDHV